MSASATSWAAGVYERDSGVRLEFDVDNKRVLISWLTTLSKEQFLNRISGGRWAFDDIESAAEEDEELGDAVAKSDVLWLALLLRDYNISADAGEMINRTFGAAAIIADAMRRLVLVEGEPQTTAERARFLYKQLDSLYGNKAHRLSMAQRGAGLGSVDGDTASEIASRVFSGDEGKALRFLEAFFTNYATSYVYDNGFVTIRVCVDDNDNEAMFFTDVVSVVLDDSLLSPQSVRMRLMRSLQPATDVTDEIGQPQYDRRDSRRVPNAYIGVPNYVWLWPPIDDSQGNRPELLRLEVPPPVRLQKVAGGNRDYFYWNNPNGTAIWLYGPRGATSVGVRALQSPRSIDMQPGKVQGSSERYLELTSNADRLAIRNVLVRQPQSGYRVRNIFTHERHTIRTSVIFVSLANVFGSLTLYDSPADSRTHTFLLTFSDPLATTNAEFTLRFAEAKPLTIYVAKKYIVITPDPQTPHAAVVLRVDRISSPMRYELSVLVAGEGMFEYTNREPNVVMQEWRSNSERRYVAAMAARRNMQRQVECSGVFVTDDSEASTKRQRVRQHIKL